MAPKTKVALHPKENTAPPPVRRNPAIPPPELAGIPANFNSFSLLDSYAAAPSFSGISSHKDQSLSSISLSQHPSQRDLYPAAIPEEVTHKNSAGSDDSDEEDSDAEISVEGDENGPEISENDENVGENSGTDSSYESDDEDAENAEENGGNSSCEDSDAGAENDAANAENDAQNGCEESDAAEESGEEDGADEDSIVGDVSASQEENADSANAETAEGTTAVSVHSDVPSENQGAQQLSVANIAVVAAAVAGFSALRQASSQEKNIVAVIAENSPEGPAKIPSSSAKSSQPVAAAVQTETELVAAAVLQCTHCDNLFADAMILAEHTTAIHAENSATKTGILDDSQSKDGGVADGTVRHSSIDDGEKLDYIPASIDDGKLMIAPCDEDISLCKKKWHECLVGYFVGSTLPDSVVKECARRMWGKKGLVDTFVKGRGFYFFRFDSEDARKRVLETGPHFMLKHNIVLQQYEKRMRLIKERQKQIAIWVKFFNIPVELMSYRGLSLVASAVGRPLYLDEATKKMVKYSVDRFTFARVCVMADADRMLPNEMFVDYGDGDEHIKIEAKYEWRPPHCVKCKVFGHSCDKREIEKTVGGVSYAEAAAKEVAKDTTEEWPKLGLSSQQTQRNASQQQAPQSSTSQQQQQQGNAPATHASQQPQSNAQQSSTLQQRRTSGQQQTSVPQASVQQKLAPQATVQSAVAQGFKQQPNHPLRQAQSQAEMQQRGRQIGPQRNQQQDAAVTHSQLQQQQHSQLQQQQHSQLQQQQLDSGALQQQRQQQQVSPSQASQRDPLRTQRQNGKEIDEEGFQKVRGKGRGRGRGNALQREGPRTRCKSRTRGA